MSLARYQGVLSCIATSLKRYMETKKLEHLNLNSVDGAQLNLDALYRIAPSYVMYFNNVLQYPIFRSILARQETDEDDMR